MDDKSKSDLPEAFLANTFKKGRSKHPNSGNRGKQLRTVLKELLESKIKINDPLDKVERVMTVNEAVALSLVHRALHGNLAAIKLIFERLEGLPKQQIELDGHLQTSQVGHDMSSLSTEELLKLEELVSKVEVHHSAEDIAEVRTIEAQAIELEQDGNDDEYSWKERD
ncbi:MAG: hypothetical protein IM547_01490 [Chitinophagaceae bacterium]|jgi:hypothetical protein|nr:hypothetical protein [Chitinophagaceae bacterium]